MTLAEAGPQHWAHDRTWRPCNYDDAYPDHVHPLLYHEGDTYIRVIAYDPHTGRVVSHQTRFKDGYPKSPFGLPSGEHLADLQLDLDQKAARAAVLRLLG